MLFCAIRGSRRAIASVCSLAAVLSTAFVGNSALAAAAPVLDRNGSFVTVEPYAPNIIRVTISSDKDLALAPAGYGFIAKPDDRGWQHSAAQGADVFQSNRLRVEVVAQPYPARHRKWNVTLRLRFLRFRSESAKRTANRSSPCPGGKWRRMS